jgi:ABC-2 type transport system ATP-binding protein
VRVANAKPEEVAKALRKIKGITEIYPVEQGVEIVASTKDDPRPAITSTIVQKSWDMLELKSMGMSLEDIFLQLTTDDAESEEEN